MKPQPMKYLLLICATTLVITSCNKTYTCHCGGFNFGGNPYIFNIEAPSKSKALSKCKSEAQNDGAASEPETCQIVN